MAEDKTPKRACPTCSGTGRAFDRDAHGGYFTDCPDCKGAGQVRDLAKAALEREATPATPAAAPAVAPSS